MDIGETLYFTERPAWRRWLQENHAAKPEIWLIYFRKSSGTASLPYNDAVEEALCFGWIDSIIKKHGPESRAQRFTPRRPGSPFSEMNKVRVRRLHEAGLLVAAGLEVAADVLDEPFSVPADIERSLRSDADVWRNFKAFPDSYKRIRVGYIESARSSPGILQNRLDYFIRMTKKNKRFGMVQ